MTFQIGSVLLDACVLAILAKEGHPRVLKAVRKIQQYSPRHGRLHGKILHSVKLTSA